MDSSANDITAMMAEQNTPVVHGRKSPKLIWIVLACVLVGVVGGIVVYQQSIKTKTTTKTSPRPVASKAPTVTLATSPSPKLLASPSASASANPAGINIVDDWENTDPEGEEEDYPGSPSPSPRASASSSPRASGMLAGASVSPSPSVRVGSSPTASRSPSPVGSRSPSPSPSSRVAMPDTSGGVPETGVFEITVGTVGVGLLLLVAGLVGLLVL